MPLKNNTAAATTEAPFEVEGDDTVIDNGAEASTSAAEASTTTAVAAQGARALASPAKKFENPFTEMKNAMTIEWDTLPRISAGQGRFEFKDDGAEILGDTIGLQLISWQESWVASPNDTKADIELVKFADNDKVSRDGTDLAAHVEALKAQGWGKAKIAHRYTLVGELTSSAKDESRVGELVQIDMPDSGRRNFNQYQVQAAFKVSKGRITSEDAMNLKLIAVVANVTGSKDTYTKITFAAA